MMMNIGCKLWLEVNQEKFFGKGPMDLLLKVDELGSLRKAAFALDMSYTKAWRLITHIEAVLETPILEKRIGGVEGGSSKLTPEARSLIARYTRMETEINQTVEQLFQKHFSEFSKP